MGIRRLLASTLALVPVLAATLAGANPTGASVVAGQAIINNQGNLLTITNTPGSIINWQGFSIGANEITRFVQQDGSSAVLNRIVGQDPSLILGTLQSNGHVFLVNPNGILFGAGSRVDVNGLVASSLDIANDDFRAGRLRFDARGANPGAVRNDGAITTPNGGRVYLIAPDVENNGLIASPQGDVVLAAGRHMELVDSRDPDLHVVVSAPEDRALNVGQIVAQAGTIGIYGALVDQRGTVNADSAVVGEDGRIVLRASGTTLLEAGSITTARGAGHGGTIHLLGDHVGLTGDASVDASGETGGGTVLVGGDYHGANAAIPNASATYLGPQTSIRADALGSGDGGRVIVWSNDATRAYGAISARGGARSGDGGFAEVSSRGFLDYRALTDLRASQGNAGELLLDPNDITIQATGTSDVPSAGSPVTFSGGPASSILTTGDLQAQLGLGNVTVSTAGGSGGPLGGHITVASAVGWSNASTLTLDADNGIAINGAITAQADGRLMLVSRGGTITQTAGIGTTYLIVDSAGDVNLAGLANGVGVLAARVGDGHSFRFRNGGSFLVSSLNGVSGIEAPNGTISLFAKGDITQIAGAPLTANSADITANNVILPEGNSVGTLSGTLIGGSASNTFTFAAAGGLTVGGTGIRAGNADVTLSTGDGPLTLDAPVTTGGGAVSLSSFASSITGPGSVTGLIVSATAVSGISLTTHTQSFSATNGANGISVANVGALTVGSVSNGTGPIAIAASGPLTVSGPVTTSGGFITLAAGPTGNPTDDLVVNGGIASSPGSGIAVATSGSILLKAGDTITINGPVTTAVSRQANLNPPTLAQCVADPTISGCSAVLPTLATCIAAPATAGCSVVLPTLASCIATPTLSGCEIVLPTLDACIATPSLAGCTVVLPTVAQCIAAPTLPGCGVQLPSLASCIATPTLSGCHVVLPSLLTCIALPTVAGCQVVLPTLASCVAAPAQQGCEAVLPTLAQCVATPALPGCSAVLPTVNQCAANPSLPACSSTVQTAQNAANDPVTQQANHVVNLVNNSVNQVTSNSQKPGDTQTQGGSSQDSGAKANDQTHKMYCN